MPGFHPDQLPVLVGAPTGKAAFNVFGMTIHCLFRLPPTQSSAKLCDLDESSASTLRVLFANTKLLIIDEISMVSSRQVFEINQRLQQIFRSKEDFGGLSVLVAGHFRQLPPVAAKHVFQPPPFFPLADLVGNYLWGKFSIFELDQIMRQQGEYQFCKALNNMAEGIMDSDDVALIRSRDF